MNSLSMFGSSNLLPSATESSSHQLVGYVTKMFPTFGYINNEIFFQRKCVIGPMVEVGDHVATNATYQPSLPIKWSAEKVWRVQDSRTLDKDTDSYWTDDTRVRSTTSRSEAHPRDSVKNAEERSRVHSISTSDRKRPITTSRSPASQRAGDLAIKRRRLSPINSHSNKIGLDKVPIRILHDVTMLNRKNQLVPEFQYQLRNLLCPVDLYRVACHWQDSFPVLTPFYPTKNTVFQLLSPIDDVLDCTPTPQSSDGYYVKLILPSMPSMNSLQGKLASRFIDGVERNRTSLQKSVKVLVNRQSKNAYSAIGGAWDANKDGSDPSVNPKTLVNTAVRCCKEQIGLDLSRCTHWHRFVEFRYSRTEGLTARPTSILFPGSQLWGHSGYSNSQQSTTTPSTSSGSAPCKPFHRIVVYLLPDLTPLAPSDEDWPGVKATLERQMNSTDASTTDNETEEHRQQQTTDNAAKDEKAGQAPLASDTPATSDAVPTTPDSTSTGLEATGTTAVATTDGLNTTTSGIGSASSPATLKTTSDHEDGTTMLKSHEELHLPSMKVSELREQLKLRNLAADGIKAQLVSRLKVAIDAEADVAKKADDERKKLEKENEEAQAALKKTEAVRECKNTIGENAGTSKAAVDNSKSIETKTGERKKITLRNIPSIVVQQLQNLVYSVPLEDILDRTPEHIDSEVYEFMFCMSSFLSMLRRDAIFILFRALVTAADRGIQAKPVHRSDASESYAKPGRSDTKDQKHLKTTISAASLASKEAASDPSPPQIVDIPLLYACSLLDTSNRGYFSLADVEDLIFSLGLPVSRYQVRSVLSKVSYHQRVHYRTLTDADPAVQTSTVGKTVTAMFSDIDDDDYLLELVRGGDAILDDQKDEALPPGSILLLRSNATETPTAGGDTTEYLNPPTPEDFVRQLRQHGFENARLQTRIQKQLKEIENLKNITKQIPILEKKLSSTSLLVDDYRQRIRTDRDRIHSVNRILEQQAFNIDSCRIAVLQAADRLRGSPPSQKGSSSDARAKRGDSVSSSNSKQRAGGATISKTVTVKTVPAKSESKINEAEPTGNAGDKDASNQPTETSQDTNTEIKIEQTASIESTVELAIVVVPVNGDIDEPMEHREDSVVVAVPHELSTSKDAQIERTEDLPTESN